MLMIIELLTWVALIWLVVSILKMDAPFILRLCLLPVCLWGFQYVLGFILGFVAALLGY